MSPPYNMGLCLIVIPVRRRRSQLPISKETPYISTLSDPQRKAEPTIGGLLVIPEELANKTINRKIFSKKKIMMKILIIKNFLLNHDNKNTYFKNSNITSNKLPIIYLFHQIRKMIIHLIMILLVKFRVIL